MFRFLLDRATHGGKRLLCWARSSTPKEPNQTERTKKLPSSFYTYLFFFLFFFFFRCWPNLAHNSIVRWSLLRQMRAHQFNEEIYVCVRSHFPYRVPRFKYTIFFLSFSASLCALSRKIYLSHTLCQWVRRQQQQLMCLFSAHGVRLCVPAPGQRRWRRKAKIAFHCSHLLLYVRWMGP